MLENALTHVRAHSRLICLSALICPFSAICAGTETFFLDKIANKW
jgi:hypothetical protein